jgi:hypothetical protein
MTARPGKKMLSFVFKFLKAADTRQNLFAADAKAEYNAAF